MTNCHIQKGLPRNDAISLFLIDFQKTNSLTYVAESSRMARNLSYL